MKDKKIVYDYSICSGCLACMVNCSQFQESHASLVSARIKIELEPFRGQYLAYFCQQCHITHLEEIEVQYLAVSRRRGQQLKDPNLIDRWVQDGSKDYISSLTDWAG
ncbi:hypothetical protein KKB54_02655 [bacterium]|nr:hypothetical protein [bacterium]MBU0899701.1 hypothetical protein [bacterium]MBU1154068.1 hypothetical protein [bacterium]MBU2599716.1 hypothetical protein [bacterium]